MAAKMLSQRGWFAPGFRNTAAVLQINSVVLLVASVAWFAVSMIG